MCVVITIRSAKSLVDSYIKSISSSYLKTAWLWCCFLSFKYSLIVKKYMVSWFFSWETFLEIDYNRSVVKTIVNLVELFCEKLFHIVRFHGYHFFSFNCANMYSRIFQSWLLNLYGVEEVSYTDKVFAENISSKCLVNLV